MEFLNDPLLYFIVPKTIKMSCMMRAKKAISLAAARGVIVAPACNSGVQRLKNDGMATNTQAKVIASESKKCTQIILFFCCRALGYRILAPKLIRSCNMPK